MSITRDQLKVGETYYNNNSQNLYVKTYLVTEIIGNEIFFDSTALLGGPVKGGRSFPIKYFMRICDLKVSPERRWDMQKIGRSERFASYHRNETQKRHQQNRCQIGSHSETSTPINSSGIETSAPLNQKDSESSKNNTWVAVREDQLEVGKPYGDIRRGDRVTRIIKFIGESFVVYDFVNKKSSHRKEERTLRKDFFCAWAYRMDDPENVIESRESEIPTRGTHASGVRLSETIPISEIIPYIQGRNPKEMMIEIIRSHNEQKNRLKLSTDAEVEAKCACDLMKGCSCSVGQEELRRERSLLKD